MAKKDPLKEKQARQKKMAIGGGVLLLAVLAFQVPRTMKMLHSPGNVTTSASTAPATTTPGSTPLAPPSLDGSSASTATAGTSGSSGGSETSADGVVDASSPLPASSGQLIAFNRFKSKDPFVQQVQNCSTGACPGSSSAGASASGGATGGSGSAAGTGTNATSTSAGASRGSATGAAALQKPTTASISVNGTVSKLTVGHTFPSADPVFVLVSLTPKAAKISISGGSLEGGAPTVGLTLGKTVTLQNTADGTVYTLKLVRTAA